MNQRDEGPLAQRLAALSLQMPATLTAIVLSRASRPSIERRAHRPAWATAALAACLVLVGVIAGSYFAPRFQQALAQSPLVGSPITALLHGAGLDPLANRFEPVSSSSTSSGYRLELTAAYADANNSYVILRTSPAIFAFPRDATLTDQFGRSFELRGGVGQADGSELVTFSGVGWPDDVVGARLTLHVHSLDRTTETGGTVSGDWTLHAVLDVEAAKPYPHPMPAAGHLANNTVQVTQITASSATVKIQLHVTGPLAKHLGDLVGQEITNVTKPHPAFEVRLLGPDGQEAQPLEGGQASDLTGTMVTQTWLRPRPGLYRLAITYESVGEVDQQIDLAY